ncbi:MAG: septum formation protein, partial [Candidatus Omnitrophota bacterium]
MRMILASSSPRRKELLGIAGFTFEIIRPDVDETPKRGEDPEVHAVRIARAKADVVHAAHPDAIVIAADTNVVRKKAILGKPVDEEEAIAMLKGLSGKTHKVITGVAILGPENGCQWAVHTQVEFRDLGHGEILRYVATGDPMDKAGAYGIQGLGAHLVRGIKGSYTNVVGLPLAEIVEALSRVFGVGPD